ncbi:hypothetical protein [Terricaulis silvestris]|nr:hypothetical protein [Terricaulis silvestris]
MDRLILGVVAGAVVGGLALPLAFHLFGEMSLGNIAILGLFWFATTLTLLILIPVFHMPAWWVMERVGLRGPLGAVLAGAISMIAMPLAIGLLIFGASPGGAGQDETLRMTSIFAGVGALVGLVIWRVAKWEAVAY